LIESICQYNSEYAAAKHEKQVNPKSKIKLPKDTKSEYLVPFLTFAHNSMTEYNTKVQNGDAPDFRIKEALLYIVGSLEQEISRDKDMRANMEQML
jgi:hypothetical protein